MAAEQQYRPPRRARGKWSDAETVALVEEWAKLYRRRRDGEVDAWVPLRQHPVVRDTRKLVLEDWRAVAGALSKHRPDGDDSVRTHDQCKRRIKFLVDEYRKRLSAGAGAAPSSSWRFFSLLHGVLGGAADSGGYGQLQPPSPPAGTAEEVPPPLVQQEDVQQQHGGAAAEEKGGGRGGDVGNGGGGDVGNGGAKMEAVSKDAARGAVRADAADAAAAMEARRRAAVLAALWGGGGAARIPKRPRSAGGCLSLEGMGLGLGSSVVAAAGEVVMKVADMCQSVMMESLDVERRSAAREAKAWTAAGTRRLA